MTQHLSETAVEKQSCLKFCWQMKTLPMEKLEIQKVADRQQQWQVCSDLNKSMLSTSLGKETPTS